MQPRESYRPSAMSLRASVTCKGLYTLFRQLHVLQGKDVRKYLVVRDPRVLSAVRRVVGFFFVR